MHTHSRVSTTSLTRMRRVRAEMVPRPEGVTPSTAYLVMAYIVLAYLAMAYTVLAYLVIAFIALA